MNLGYPKFKETPQVHRMSIHVENILEKNNQTCNDVADPQLRHSKSSLSASFMIICRKSIIQSEIGLFKSTMYLAGNTVI